MSSTQRIYTIDIETDPFKFGRLPKPFSIGLYTGDDYYEEWGEGCIDRMQKTLLSIEPAIIYAHNGGRFDVLGYLMHWVLGNPMRVINNRIVKCHMVLGDGTQHEIRDSYSIFPFRLGDYKGKSQKLEIAIGKLEDNECWEIDSKRQSISREVYRDEILEYLRMDCVALHELMTGFIGRYGPELTIGTTAMKQLKSMHSFDTLDGNSDAEVRAMYFYGGRVDCLKSGVIHGDYKLYDVNSMYPYVMANFDHPIGASKSIMREITEDTCFVTATGWNDRAFPVRDKDGSLNYLVKYGKFHVSIHEWRMAMKLGLFKVKKVHHTFDFAEQTRFDTFVNTFYDGRKKAKAAGDEIEALCLKYVLNSAYGKFAQSPDNYKECIVTEWGVDMQGWSRATAFGKEDNGEYKYCVWNKPSPNCSRFNVATGASITGAARSVLMEAIAYASDPVYCDTDSLLCRTLPLDLDDSKLGSWKLEAEIDTAAIAGKKLYAFFKDGNVVKKAHKGFKITGQDIMRICEGQTVVSYNDAPTFKLDGSYRFVERKARMTV